MTRIKTKRNRVVADDPEPGDIAVQVAWQAPVRDGLHSRYLELPWMPISDYDEIVEWAVGFADCLAHPIYVLPLNHGDILDSIRFGRCAKVFANLSDPERREMHRLLGDACVALMRDCDDPAVRAAAYQHLQALSVVSSVVGAET